MPKRRSCTFLLLAAFTLWPYRAHAEAKNKSPIGTKISNFELRNSVFLKRPKSHDVGYDWSDP